MIADLVNLVPEEIRPRSGKVFYSGAAAFAGRRDIYILGLNPGGDPVEMSDETIQRELDNLPTVNPERSEYLDVSWCGRPPGTSGIQPRILHLLERLGRDPHLTPASNLIFVRTRSEWELHPEREHLAQICWPFHDAIIRKLYVRVIVALGVWTGRTLREHLDSHRKIDEFVESNRRGWRSTVHEGPSGIRVATLSHPTRANWRNPASDPSELVHRALILGATA